MVSITAYLVVAAVLFGIGTVGVLISRNMIIMFMSIELMLNAANLALIAFSLALNEPDPMADRCSTFGRRPARSTDRSER